MANNIIVKDAAGVTQTVRTTDNGGVHVPHHNAQLQVAGADVSASNRVPVSAADLLEVSGSATSAAVLFTQDTAGYQSVAVQVTSAGSATIAYEVSNDGAAWFAVAGYTPLNLGTTTPVTTSTTALLLVFPCLARFFRARVSVYTSGTVSVVAEFRKEAIPQLGVYVGNVNGTVTSRFENGGALASAATNALSKARVKSAAGTNATAVKASAGRLYQIHVCNISAALKFLKFYNKASAPTVGTDTPVATYPIAPNGGRVDVVSIAGISFATGIAYAITGAIGDGDTTSVGADEVTGELLYA